MTISTELGPVFPAKTDGLLFLDETGTGNYYDAAQRAILDAALAAGRKPPFPFLFGLAGALFRRSDYVRFHREFRSLKQRHFASDLPLHEYDLRRLRTSDFKPLANPANWTAFRDDLQGLVSATPFKIFIATFHKPAMQDNYKTPFHPYKYALEVILERVIFERRWYGRTCRIIAENRQAGLNNELCSELLRLQYAGGGSGIVNSSNTVSADELRATFDPQITFRLKRDNDSGLQIADLAAGPLTRHIYGLDVGEPRSVRDIVEAKLCVGRSGRIMGCGVMCFPQGVPAPAPY